MNQTVIPANPAPATTVMANSFTGGRGSRSGSSQGRGRGHGRGRVPGRGTSSAHFVEATMKKKTEDYAEEGNAYGFAWFASIICK